MIIDLCDSEEEPAPPAAAGSKRQREDEGEDSGDEVQVVGMTGTVRNI